MFFFVPCTPAAQPRPRFNTKSGRAYNPSGPAKTVKAATVAAFHGQGGTTEPLEGPVSMTLTFIFPRPQAMIWKKKKMPKEWHTKKPDIDNLEKTVLDALNGLAYKDDSQVCCVLKSKVIASGSDVPGISVTIDPINLKPA